MPLPLWPQVWTMPLWVNNYKKNFKSFYQRLGTQQQHLFLTFYSQSFTQIVNGHNEGISSVFVCEIFRYSKVPKNNPRLLHSTDWNGIAQIQITRDISHTRQHGHHRPREFKFKFTSTLDMSAHGVTFQHMPIGKSVCATVHHSSISAAQFYIYVALFTYRPFDAQQQEVYWKCQKAAISTDPRRLLIDLF